MIRIRITAAAILLFGVLVGWFVYSSEASPESKFPLKLGLDLAGGTHLIYRADTSNVSGGEVGGAMSALRDVIERRVNLFGVSEPLVQVENSSILSGVEEKRLIVELPGVTDVEKAVKLIGDTPLLEFKLLKNDYLPQFNSGEKLPDGAFENTGLTGRYLKRAQLEFGASRQGALSNEPVILLEFTGEGGDLFADITKANVGGILAIFLDGAPISTPVIREEIAGGRATITGVFKPDEARRLVRDLNFGALPLPIELISTQTVGASLGSEAFEKGVMSGILGLVSVAFFLIFWYRLPGVVSVISLVIYVALMIALFKLIPVTRTSAGVAGFILSIGLAVDANVLIFERMREEFADGKSARESIKNGFKRAWLPIRDGNLSSVITAIILFWFGTSIVEGFALTFGIGIMVSMFTAIMITRTLLLSISGTDTGSSGLAKFLFGVGFSK